MRRSVVKISEIESKKRLPAIEDRKAIVYTQKLDVRLSHIVRLYCDVYKTKMLKPETRKHGQLTARDFMRLYRGNFDSALS